MPPGISAPMAKRDLQDAITARGWRPGTHLENLVALILSRSGYSPKEVEQQCRIGRFRVDFAWPGVKIALEADGWWHRSPEGAAKDAERDSFLRSEGWVVLRVDDRHGDDSLDAQVQRVTAIVAACRQPRTRTIYHYFNHPYR